MTLRDGPARRLLLLALLVGPLIAAEVLARSQLEFLYPYLRRNPHFAWIDLKLLLLEHAGCPQVLALGSSITNHALTRSAVKGLSLPFDDGPREVDSLFTFGVNGAPASLLDGVWRRIRQQGCAPEYLFLEVSPTVLSHDPPLGALYTPTLDLGALLHLPNGFVEHAGFHVLALTDVLTLCRLFVYRRRDEIRAALGDTLAAARLEEELALDGAVHDPLKSRLRGTRLKEERARRLDRAGEGEYVLTVAALEIRVLGRLIDDARRAGSRVVLHTPPVSSLYHEIVDGNPESEDFSLERAGIVALLAAEDPARETHVLEWYWCYGSDSVSNYGNEDFYDWIHMNETGQRRYARSLFDALKGGTAPQDGCEILSVR